MQLNSNVGGRGSSLNTESFSHTTFLDSALRSYSFLNKNLLSYKLNKSLFSSELVSHNSDLLTKEVFMLETGKNFLSNSSDLDILNNLTELKRDDVTSLKYFQHFLNNSGREVSNS
tara:strand:- start:13 stop:360 length:348 start_codon:yes stop_codon:yes gene_type:complete